MRGPEQHSFKCYEYRLGGVLFEKALHSDGRASLWINGEPVTAADWNLAVNRFQSMVVKESSPNPLIRLLERHRRRAIVMACRPGPSERWADLGCESGFIAEALASRCGQLVCVDGDHRLLELARARLASHRNVTYVCADAVAVTEIAKASLDGCLAAEILEHLVDVDAFLSEIARMVKPGGRIVLTVPNDGLITAVKRLLGVLGLRFLIPGLSTDLAIGHLRVWDRPTLVSCLQSRFEAVSVRLPFPYLNFICSVNAPRNSPG